ncbi:MAG: hypothetical protein DHS20C16_10370 [Phycisphaerae bacterium]|nr:MAG: hypothetical protein DHS20C16_10370 [Phycisphaerae bacterium]
MRIVSHRSVLLGCLTCIFASTASAQFVSDTVDFNQAPIGSPENSQEIFRIPQFSPSSSEYIVANSGGSLDNNATFRDTAVAPPTAGNVAALHAIFQWVDEFDPDAWVRLTSANGPITPNPGLSTAGKVRLIFTSQIFTSDVGLAIGIRETGAEVPQLSDGGTAGPIEWVGVTTDLTVILGNSNGIESTPAGDDIFVNSSGIESINWGPNRILETTPSGDDVATSGFIIAGNGGRTPVPAITLVPSFFGQLVEWDLAAGTVRVSSDTTPGNFGAPVGGFAAFTGNATLADAPNGRGVLEHLVVTNVITSPAPDVQMAIDDLVFDSPVADPAVPPSLVEPIVAGDLTVTVTDLIPDVNEVRVFRNNQTIPERTVAVANNDDLEVTLLAPAVADDIFWAKQTSAFTGTSGFSEPATAIPPGLLIVETFDTYTTQEEMQAVWNNSIGSPTDELTLESGNAVSCNNFIQEFNENSTTFAEARSYRGFGSANGSDATPLRATWRFRHTSESANMRTRFELARFGTGDWSAGPRAFGSTGFTFTNQIAGPFLTDYNVAIRSDVDPDGAGTVFVLDPGTGYYTAATGVVRTADVWRKFEIVVETDFINYYIDDQLITFAGLPDGVPRPNASAYEFVILGVGLSTNAGQMQWDDIAVTTGSPVLPFGDPPPLSPQIGGSLLPNDTSVSVIDVNTNATRVTVYEDATSVGFVNSNGGFETTSLVVSVPPLNNGSLVTVRQTVDGVESCDSDVFPVGAAPGAPTVVTPVQEGDATVTVENVDLSATLVTVYVGSNSVGSIDPQGALSVDVPVTGLVALETVTATATNPVGESDLSEGFEIGRGNGVFLLSVGVRETGGAGPVGDNAGTANGIEWIGPAEKIGGAPQGKPVTPGPTWQAMTFDPGVDDILAFAGSGANGVIDQTWGALEHIAITPDGDNPDRSVGAYDIYIDNIRSGGTLLTDFESFTTGASDVLLRTPTFSGSTSGNLNPPPNSVGIAGIGNPGKSINAQFHFVDSGENRWVRLTTNNAANLPNPFVRLDMPLTFDILVLERQPPAAPSLESPLQEGDTTVTVNDILPDALTVDVLADGGVIASVDPMGASNGFEITVPPLVHLEEITVRQSTSDGASAQSAGIEVGIGNGVVTLALGIRETGDLGPIGSEGTTLGSLEWIGASGSASGAPIGLALSPSNSWQTVTFDPTGNVFGFTGDGVLDTATGTLEHLAISADDLSPNRSTGVYRMYIDNVVNVEAGPGDTDVVITDFEGFALGDEVLFQEPTFSGSTADNLLFPPSASANSDNFNNGGTRSQLITWFFRDTTEGSWVRLTTSSSGGGEVPNPIIDLTKQVRMDILLLAGCPTALGDFDGDCDIDDQDMIAFNACLASGPAASAGPGCVCGDFDNNGQVDLEDYQGYQEAAGIEDANGGSIPACTP